MVTLMNSLLICIVH